MPQRRNQRRVDSPQIQGEDSYVVFRAATSAERDELTKGSKEREGDEEAQKAVGRQLLALRILDWNWVDDEGRPLPLPKDDLTVFGRLLEHEMDFLLEEGTKPI